MSARLRYEQGEKITLTMVGACHNPMKGHRIGEASHPGPSSFVLRQDKGYPFQPQMPRVGFVVRTVEGLRKGEPIQCALCLYRCTAKELHAHEIGSHDASCFRCLTCGMIYRNSKELRRHSRLHQHAIQDEFATRLDRECEATRALNLLLVRGGFIRSNTFGARSQLQDPHIHAAHGSNK